MVVAMVLCLWFLTGCISPRISLFGGGADGLEEYTLRGEGEKKVLMVPVDGVLSDAPRKKLLGSSESMVQEVVSRLRKAEKDPDVGALLLKIDSPGGTVTASDLLYHEVRRFKERTGKKVVAVFMNVAASGGYYMALPADLIFAHPTSVTGSVGVIFMRPRVDGLMERLGVGVSVSKSGENKDMGSPFRRPTPPEAEMIQGVVDRLARRFYDLVEKHRPINPEAMAKVATARVYLAEQALELGLIDRIGYLDEAVSAAKSAAGLPESARVVIYGRTEDPDGTYYSSPGADRDSRPVLVDTGLPRLTPDFAAGFYYLWPAALGGD